MGFGQPLTNCIRDLGGNAQISIGTDIESAMAAEMFSVTRFALQAARHETTRQARLETGKPPAETGVSARGALEWATIGGARMLGLDRNTGTLEVGKLADINLVNAHGINLRLMHNPIASLLFHAGPRDVDTVWVEGRIVKQNGELHGQDMESLRDDLEESANRIMHDFSASLQ